MTKWLLVALLLPTLAVALPANSSWPGGIAVVPLGEQATRPEVKFENKNVLVVREDSGWVAVAGIPLDATPGTADLEIDNRSLTFEIVSHAYREQHLTVKPSYVNPDPDALARIKRESAMIAKAIRHYSDTAPAMLNLQAPIPGRQGDSFGSRRFFNKEPRSPHRGMDISGKRGTPIQAPLDGRVILSGEFYFTGNAVFIDHGAGLITLYAHLDKTAVTEGDIIATGDLIGEVGATGRVTGAHLHFATYLNGTPVDPALLLKPLDEP